MGSVAHGINLEIYLRLWPPLAATFFIGFSTIILLFVYVLVLYGP